MQIALSKTICVILGMTTLACPVAASAQGACAFNYWTSYQGTLLSKHASADAYMFKTDHMRIDADGAPNAYGPNNSGLDDIRNAGYPDKSWWKSVLVADPADPKIAYIQKTGKFAGFYISKTALSDRQASSLDPAKYVDATTVPYLVLPGKFAKLKGTGRLGDVGVAVHLDTGLTTEFVVADIGPSEARLGEVSMALAEELGGKGINPRNGAGQPKGDVMYVVFRFSSAKLSSDRWPVSPQDLAQRSKALLQNLGGLSAITKCK